MASKRATSLGKRGRRVWAGLAVTAVLLAGLAMLWGRPVVDEGVQSFASDRTSPEANHASQAPIGFGGTWSSDVAPFGEEASLADAQAEAGYELFRPDAALASDASLSHVWVGTEEPGGEDMLPNYPQTKVALAYSSGIQVTVVPWVYGVNVPPFSQKSNAESYEIAASQHGYYSTLTIEGIPVLTEAAGDTGSGWIEFNLGTENADALTIAVIGNRDASDLESVAESIIKQWIADHPPAGV